MKKMLLLNIEFPPVGGGASPVCYDFASELSKSGFDIDVVTMRARGLPAFETINAHLKIHRVFSLRKKREVSHPWEQLIYIFSAFLRICKLQKINKYDLCYCFFIIPTGVLALAAKLFFKIPYFIASHGSDVIGYNTRFKFLYPFLKLPWRLIVRQATFVTAPSTFLKNKISSAYPDYETDRVVVIPNIISKGLYTPMKKHKTILLVSRLHKHKGLQDFIAALREVDLNDWKIQIMGDGPYRDSLVSMLEQVHLTDKFELLGWVTDKEEKRKIYGEAQVFVNPSHLESFSMTNIEAAMAGCTCILTNTGIASDLDNVYMYEAGDIKALHSILIKVLSENKTLTSQSYEQFYPEKVIKALLEKITESFDQ